MWQVLFTMRGNVSLVYQSCKTSHSYSCRCYNDKSSEEEVLKCLRVSKFMGIVILRPATLPQLITDVVKVVNIVILRPSTLPKVIAEVVDVGQV